MLAFYNIGKEKFGKERKRGTVPQAHSQTDVFQKGVYMEIKDLEIDPFLKLSVLGGPWKVFLHAQAQSIPC